MRRGASPGMKIGFHIRRKGMTGQSVIQAFVNSDCLKVGTTVATQIPHMRLTRTGIRYHHWSYPGNGPGRTGSSVCNRPAVQQSPFRRRYASCS